MRGSLPETGRKHSLDGCVLDLREVSSASVALVGGKAAHLGALSRIEGIPVPAGFCVTTRAFRRITADGPEIARGLDRLSRLKADDQEGIRGVGAELRAAIESIALPDNLVAAITRQLVSLDDRAAYAVRSSATAEDMPAASFAGQHDTYLNVVGTAAVLAHVRRCWASLFTARAITYRLRNDVDHRAAAMAVVVQRMVFPPVSGILFTADPATSNRRVVSVEATFGLGEALVSGRVNADVYKVRDGTLVSKTVGRKQLAIVAAPDGGTQLQTIPLEQQLQPALTDVQVVRLAAIGRRLEAHFGRPQDIEWCLVDDEFQIVQSRPITTLFPIPVVADQERHVYVSVGHQQMMTDAMKPLGISLWQLTAVRPMFEAGGRIFVDVGRALASPATRAAVVRVLGRSDPLIGDALQAVVDRGFIPSLPEETPAPPPADAMPVPIETSRALVAELVELRQASIAALKRNIQAKTGTELIDFILADLQELQRLRLDQRSYAAILAAIKATLWLNDHLRTWLGEKNVADTLTLSAPNNVTSEMGLALLDVADVVRRHPDVIAFLQTVEDDTFLNELPTLAGGSESREAINGWLLKYGMRCVGEIDITRPRWSEHPVALVPVILGHIKNHEPGEGLRRFEQGRREAEHKENDVLARLRLLPEGERKADETRRTIERLRTFIGYREYPKYAMICRYFVYKQALLAEAGRLVRAGVLRETDDVFYLTLPEIRDVVSAQRADAERIRQRREAFASYQALTPPRVFTSEGEIMSGKYRRDDLPGGALVGLPVSSGTVEGRARVIRDMAEAKLEPGDILVTTYTDPSWTPLFVAIKGLVTEVGGLMTHGAVIAREYGLPAVVGVEHATRLIPDGQRIRVHGTDGYVELLSAEAEHSATPPRAPPRALDPGGRDRWFRSPPKSPAANPIGRRQPSAG